MSEHDQSTFVKSGTAQQEWPKHYKNKQSGTPWKSFLCACVLNCKTETHHTSTLPPPPPFLFSPKRSTAFSWYACFLFFSGSEQNIGELELCAGSCSSPQGEQLFRQFLPLPQALQTPDLVSPSTQLYLSSLPLSHSVPFSQPDSGLLGAGLNQLQLGSFSEDPAPACSEYVASRRLQMDFSLPSLPVPSVPDFGVLGSLLCPPSSICSAPIQHSNSPVQRRKTFQI